MKNTNEQIAPLGELTMIELKNISKKYDDFIAVDDVSFSVGSGEIVGLLGHNGAGKTTIMRMITGFLSPTSGQITVDNKVLNKDTISEIQRKIGYLPEKPPSYPDMLVIDYLRFVARLKSVAEADIDKQVLQALDRTNLKDKALTPISILSRGYQQRVGVAQAIVHSPPIIILDEPTNGLDPNQIVQMRELIKELAKTAIVILSTHIMQEVKAVCTRVLMLRAGKLVLNTNLADLQSNNQFTVTLRQADHDKGKTIIQQNASISREQVKSDGVEMSLSGDSTSLVSKCLPKLYEQGIYPLSFTTVSGDIESVFRDLNS